MAKLYMMMGLPGSGKTTFAHDYFDIENNNSVKYISRDDIRFNLLKKYNDEDNYFGHEEEVFNTFCFDIKHYLTNGYDVIADATHINHASRSKLINAITNIKVLDNGKRIVHSPFNRWIVIFLNPDVELCIENNRKRKGLARVPEKVIYRMNRNLEYPELRKDMFGIGIDEIWTVTSSVKKWYVNINTFMEVPYNV